MTEELTNDEKKALQEYFESFGATVPEEKHTLHTFLNKVATSSDTTKTGFLKDEELGISEFPVRSYKSFALWSNSVIKNEYLTDFFDKESEIVTATSLSRQGFLDKLAVTQKRESSLRDMSEERKPNTGWFKKKQPEEQLT